MNKDSSNLNMINDENRKIKKNLEGVKSQIASEILSQQDNVSSALFEKDLKFIRILHIEDNPGEADLVRELLDESSKPFHVEVTHFDRLNEAITHLKNQPFDLILLDLNLPDSCGIKTFIQVFTHVRRIPIIIMAEMADKDLALMALRKGAQHYLIKDQLTPTSIIKSIRSTLKQRKVLDLIWETEKKFRFIAEMNAEMTKNNRKQQTVHLHEELDSRNRKLFTLQRTNSELRESDLRFRTIFKQSPIGCVTFSKDESLREVNQSVLDMLGVRDRDSLKRINLFKVLKVPRSIKHHLKNKGHVKYEISIDFDRLKRLGLLETTFSDFRNFTVLITIITLPSEESGLEYLVLLKKNIEKTRVELEKRLSEFITTTSHELRTPVHLIQGWTEFLETHGSKITSQIRIDIFNKIKKNIRRLTNLIEGVSKISEIKRGDFRIETELLDFHTFMTEITKPFKDFLGNQLEIVGLENLNGITVEGDPEKLRFVIENVVGNAIKNTAMNCRKIRIKLNVQSDFIRLSITDNGAGIASDDIERIFEEFVSIPTEYSAKGSGLGLFISRKIAKSHGGSLTARSKGKGFGSTFTLEIPRGV